ncbi:MAG: hypothetical protein J5524_08625 [Bacteroidaceae bacterium]|nr:hypothetical protein [Bacteroidaceae bacterium]MBO4841146.1 hypothetical protein [Bacteroidaceae bacterium]
MKKSCHIGISLLLSILLLFIGSGVNILHCTHTGAVRIMSVLGSEEMHDEHCNARSCCMTMEHVELSPTDMAHAVTYDFHVVQPVLTILPCLISEWLQPTIHKTDYRYARVAWKYPPRDYLNFIQILLI